MTHSRSLHLAVAASAALLFTAGAPAPSTGQQAAPSGPPPEPAPPAPVAAVTPVGPAPSPVAGPDRGARGALPEAPSPPTGFRQRSYLGVALADVSARDVERLGLPEERGALIEEVVDGSPADSAGLRAGDVVVDWRGEAVFSAAELGRLVRETPPGRAVDVGLIRHGERRTVTVVPREREGASSLFRGELPPEARARLQARLDDARERLEGLEDMEELEDLHERLGDIHGDMRWVPEAESDSIEIRRFRFAPRPGGEGAAFWISDRSRLGVRTQSLTPQLADYFGLGDRTGVLVASVRDGSPADSAGLQAGDVLVSVGDGDVSHPGDVVRAVRAASGDVEMGVLRRGEERTLTVRLPEPGDEGDGA